MARLLDTVPSNSKLHNANKIRAALHIEAGSGTEIHKEGREWVKVTPNGRREVLGTNVVDILHAAEPTKRSKATGRMFTGGGSSGLTKPARMSRKRRW